MPLTLRERRSVVRALPRRLAAELAERFAHAIEVVPTFDRRKYKLTARGYVGWLTLDGVKVVFRPKRPWAEVRALFSPSPLRGGGRGVGSSEATPPSLAVGVRQEAGLLDLLAHRLAALMLARASAGLARGYVERELSEPHLRGRIDLPAQLRQQFRTPGTFEQVADEFTPDIPANRLPKATAARLLREPELGADARAALERATAAFDGVSETPLSVADRPDGYRELHEWCDLIGREQVLVSLERAFEGYATRLFCDALGDAVRPQREIGGVDALGVASRQTVSLVPDLTVYDRDRPAAVWDAKWKRPDPTAADVHQVLAYAAALGLPAGGLVYPGRGWKLTEVRAGVAAVRLLRLPLTDDPVRMKRVVRRLRRTSC